MGIDQLTSNNTILSTIVRISPAGAAKLFTTMENAYSRREPVTKPPRAVTWVRLPVFARLISRAHHPRAAERIIAIRDARHLEDLQPFDWLHARSHLALEREDWASVLAAAFGIINTLLTAVYERRREIGIMQAVGGTRRTLFLAFMLESGLYGLLGGMLGGLVGMLAAYLFGPYLTDNAFTASLRHSPVPAVDSLTLALTIGFSICLALVAGLYPAYRAAKLSPMEAIRHV